MNSALSDIVNVRIINLEAQRAAHDSASKYLQLQAFDLYRSVMTTNSTHFQGEHDIVATKE